VDQLIVTRPARTFVGWKCGWETTPNSQYAYFKDGNSYYDRADDPKWDNANKQFIGYNAAKTSGIQTSGVLDYEHSYDVFMKIIGRHLGFLTSTARALGLPREKLFAHTIAQGVDRYNMDSQFNAHSNPSPSFYGKPTTSLRDNPSFMRCLAKARAELGTTGYGIGEFRFGATDHDTWYRWFTGHFARRSRLPLCRTLQLRHDERSTGDRKSDARCNGRFSFRKRREAINPRRRFIMPPLSTLTVILLASSASAYAIGHLPHRKRQAECRNHHR